MDTNSYYDKLFNGLEVSPNAGALAEVLPADFDRSRLLYFSSVESTNGLLMSMPGEAVPDGLIILADNQSAGRGRRGNSFHCEKNKGIYVSCIYDCSGYSREELYTFTSRAAVDICSIIRDYCGVQPGIKWVNDVILKDRKIGGILTEAHTMSEHGRISKIVFGLGLNVNNQVFPSELEGKAGSLLSESGKEFPVTGLTAAIVSGLRRLGKTMDGSEYAKRYRELSVTIGREVQYQAGGELITGTAIGIDDSYNLLVKSSSGEISSLNAGVVSIRTARGYL